MGGIRLPQIKADYLNNANVTRIPMSAIPRSKGSKVRVTNDNITRIPRALIPLPPVKIRTREEEIRLERRQAARQRKTKETPVQSTTAAPELPVATPSPTPAPNNQSLVERLLRKRQRLIEKNNLAVASITPALAPAGEMLTIEQLLRNREVLVERVNASFKSRPSSPPLKIKRGRQSPSLLGVVRPEKLTNPRPTRYCTEHNNRAVITKKTPGGHKTEVSGIPKKGLLKTPEGFKGVHLNNGSSTVTQPKLQKGKLKICYVL